MKFFWIIPFFLLQASMYVGTFCTSAVWRDASADTSRLDSQTGKAKCFPLWSPRNRDIEGSSYFVQLKRDIKVSVPGGKAEASSTEAFLMKNAKLKLCLQASTVNGNLLLEDCDPESDFQDWSWQGDSLMNRGTQSCLSVVGADRVQTSLCDGTSSTRWECSNSLLSPLGSSQDYLVANKKGVALTNVRGLKAQWQDVDRSVCEVKAAEAEPDRYFTAALASTHMYNPMAGNVTLALGIDEVELEELLWFFRREDPSTWNYSILALSFVAMILGLLLLTINIVRNRKRKIHTYGGAEQTTQQAELEAKQALMPVQEYSPAEPLKQEPVPQDQRSGDVVVQWKDGTVTSLYAETPENAI